jgi:crossover junction endodeoxyribonuclease RusA
MDYTFTVYGVPAPQGSIKAFVTKRSRRVILTSDCKKLKPWRQEISGTALAAMNGCPPAAKEVGVGVYVDFFFDRPKSVSKKWPDKTTKPDVDKLLRALFDALTGIAFVDDSQVVRGGYSKQFGSPARAVIRVVTAEQRTA